MSQGKPLPFTQEKWTGRLDSADMDLLRAVHPGAVSEVIRALVKGYTDRLRTQMQGTPR